MHGDAGGLEDRAGVLSGTCGDLARRAIHRDDDIAGARHERGELVSRRGTVCGEADGRAQWGGVREDRIGRRGRGPQGAGLAVDGDRVRLGGAHDDRVAVAHGLTGAGLHEVVAANAHARGMQRVPDGVTPGGHGARDAVDLEHDGCVRGGDTDPGDAEDTRRGEGGDAEDDARGRREGTHVGAQDVQGACGGRTQGGAQVVVHDSPVTRYWYCRSA